MDELKATAQLPNMTIELSRREIADGEQIVVQITARPSFQAVEAMLSASMQWMLPWMMLNPFVRIWADMLDQPGAPQAPVARRKSMFRAPQLRLVRPSEEK